MNEAPKTTKEATKKAKVESYDISRSDETLDLAKDLAKFIKDNKLSTTVQGKEFVNVEGWQYAGSRLGIVPIVEHVINVGSEQEIKYQAKVQLWDLRSQHTVGAGFAVCSNKESSRKFYQEFAIMSMAQTRAVGKAYRNILAWIIRAAGYEPTPSEEMDYNTNVPTAQPAATPGKSEMPAAPSSAPLAASAGAAPSNDLSSDDVLTQLAGLRSVADLTELWNALTGGQRTALKTDFTAARERIEADIKRAASTPLTPAPVMQILPDSITTPTERPDDEHGEPVPYATASQKEEVIRLLNHPVITRQEKTKVLLNINRLTEYVFAGWTDAPSVIAKLRQNIDKRENATTGPQWAEQLKDVVKSAELAGEAGTPLLSADDVARFRKVAYDPGATPNQLRDALYEARELVQIAAIAAA